MRCLLNLLLLCLILSLIFGCTRQVKKYAVRDETIEPKIFVGKISFEGNKSFSSKLLKSKMRTKEKEEYDDFRLQEDKKKIISFYRKNGFLDVKIRTKGTYDAKSGRLDQTLIVEEGVQTRVKEIGMSGNKIIKESDLRKEIQLKAGEPLNLLAVDLSKYSILSLYGNRGYPYCEVDTAITRDRKRHEAIVEFKIEEGKLVHIGKIEIRNALIDSSENPPKPAKMYVRRRLIERELTVKSNDILISDKVYESQQKVYATGLFKNVKFERVGFQEKRDTIDLILWVEEEKLKWVGLGGGYQSPDRVQSIIEWGHDNLFNNAQQLGIKVLFAYGFKKRNEENDYRVNYDITYVEPYFLSFPVRGIGRLFYRRERQTTTLRDSGRDSSWFLTQTGGEGKVEKSLHGGIQILGGYRYVYQQEGKSTTSSLVGSFTKDVRNDIFNPTSGWFFTMTSEGAGGILKGDQNFVRSVLEGSGFVSLGGFMTIGTHVKIGEIKGYGKTTVLPDFETFKLGGGNSIRGYQENSILLPAEILKNSEGMLLGNMEIRMSLFTLPFPPYGTFWGATFLDGGNVWQTLTQVTRRGLYYGFGCGVRYITPIGPARVDYGWPMEHSTKFKDGRMYVSLGHAF